MSQQTTTLEQSPQVVQVYEENDRLYIKTFLSNSLLNKQGWSLENREEKLKEFEGKIGILTPKNYHPIYHKEMADIIHNATKQGAIIPRLQMAKMLEAYQKKYQVTVLRKVEKDKISNVDGYSIYHEATNPAFIKMAKQRMIPRFVSPTVFELDDERSSDGIIRNYYPLHVAFVDSPAWPEEHARVKGTCSGGMQECFKGLAQAAMSNKEPVKDYEVREETDNGNCPYCMETAIKEFTNLVESDKYTSLVAESTKQGAEIMSEKAPEEKAKEEIVTQKVTETSRQPVNQNPPVTKASEENNKPNGNGEPEKEKPQEGNGEQEAKLSNLDTQMEAMITKILKNLGIDKLKEFYEQSMKDKEESTRQNIADKLARYLTPDNYKGDKEKLAEEKAKFEAMAPLLNGRKVNPNDEFDLLDFTLTKTFGRAPAEILATQEVKKKVKQGAMQEDYVERTVSVGGDITPKPIGTGSFHDVNIF